jgi:glycosyltransferase involved in cell wall biosynthesis
MRYSKSGGTVWVAANTTWYVYNFRRRLIETLLELGYRVVAYSPIDDYVPRVEELGVRYVRLPIDNASTNPLREFATLLRMYWTLRRERPAILLTFTPKVNIYGSLAARMLGIPVIANLSGLGRAFVTGGWLEFMVRRLYRLALARARTVFFQNEEDRTLFVGSGLVELRKAKRLPGSGVDIERFQPSRGRRETDRFVFLLGGRLLWDKGVGQFVEAAREIKRQVPQTEFRLVGFVEVPNPSAISRAQIDAWNAEGVVLYHGATDDMPSRLAESDCVVLPSYYKEGVPRTLLEAASMGIPIITTDTPGCRDTVEDGVTGFLVKPRDPQDLADKMKRVLCLSPEERDAMGKRGRNKMCREFDERVVIDSYVNAIREIDGAIGAIDSPVTHSPYG